MTWPDVLLVFAWILFLGLGAKLGSLWTGACIIGGFLGAALVDYYAIPAATLLGGFGGASVVAAVGLYFLGLAVTLIPGRILSRASSAVFLGLIDSAFGLFTGAFTGFFLLALGLLVAIPMFPSIEKSPSYRGSALLKPCHQALEEIFNNAPFQFPSATKKIENEAAQKISPLAQKARQSWKSLRRNFE